MTRTEGLSRWEAGLSPEGKLDYLLYTVEQLHRQVYDKPGDPSVNGAVEWAYEQGLVTYYEHHQLAMYRSKKINDRWNQRQGFGLPSR